MMNDNTKEQISQEDAKFTRYLNLYGKDFSNWPIEMDRSTFVESYSRYLEYKSKFVKNLGEESRIVEINRIMTDGTNFQATGYSEGKMRIERILNLKIEDYRLPFLLKDYEFRLKQQLGYIRRIYEEIEMKGGIEREFMEEDMIKMIENTPDVIYTDVISNTGDCNKVISNTGDCNKIISNKGDSNMNVISNNNSDVKPSTSNNIGDAKTNIKDVKPSNNIKDAKTGISDGKPNINDVKTSISDVKTSNKNDCIDDSNVKMLNDSVKLGSIEDNSIKPMKNEIPKDDSIQSKKICLENNNQIEEGTSPSADHGTTANNTLNPLIISQYSSDCQEAIKMDLESMKRRNDSRIKINFKNDETVAAVKTVVAKQNVVANPAIGAVKKDETVAAIKTVVAKQNVVANPVIGTAISAVNKNEEVCDKVDAIKKQLDEKAAALKKQAEEKAIAPKKQLYDKVDTIKKQLDEKAVAMKKQLYEKAAATKKQEEEKTAAMKKQLDEKIIATKRQEEEKTAAIKKQTEILNTVAVNKINETVINKEKINENAVNKEKPVLNRFSISYYLSKSRF